MAPISFRNSKITYYGPHSCDNCGVDIVKMGREWGGTAFTAPNGPIYPNTEWHPHVCDPSMVKTRLRSEAEARVKHDWPNAHLYETGNGKGFVVLAYPAKPGDPHALVISPNCTYFDTPDAAWTDALRRQEDGLPTWHLDLARDAGTRFTDDLQRLPQC